MRKQKTNEVAEQTANRLPLIIADLTAMACLANFPLALMTYQFISNTGTVFVGLRNEKKTRILVESLRERIDKLESSGRADRTHLESNLHYQDAAHARLLKITSMDTEHAIGISANLIAMSALLSGEKNRDAHILRAICEILPEEVEILSLTQAMEDQFQNKISNFTHEHRSDAQIYTDARSVLENTFKEQARKLVGGLDFDHLISKLENMGLLANDKGFVELHQFSTRPSPLGRYFVQKYREITG